MTVSFPKASETFILRDLAWLAQNGLSYRVLCLEKGDPAILDDFGIPGDAVVEAGGGKAPLPAGFLRLPGLAGLAASFKHRSDLRRMLAAAVDCGVRPSRVHALFAGLPAWLAASIAAHFDIPFSAGIHAGDVYLAPMYYGSVLRRADFINACNRCVASELAAAFPEVEKKLHIVYHGLPGVAAAAAPVPRLSGGSIRLLAIGRFVPKKGFVHAVEAVGLLVSRGLDAHLVLAGDGPDRSTAAAARELASAGRVVLPGWAAGGVTGAIERQGPFSALLVPSVVDSRGDRDGIPNVLLEAWQAGLPVICTSVGGIPEVAVDGLNALVVPPGNPAALADAAAKIASDEELACRIIKHGRDTLAESFDQDTNLTRWAALLRNASPPA